MIRPDVRPTVQSSRINDIVDKHGKRFVFALIAWSVTATLNDPEAPVAAWCVS